jgi:hypothetical protein
MKARDWKNAINSIQVPDDTEVLFIDHRTKQRLKGLEINYCFVTPETIEVILIPYDTLEQ